MKYAVEIVVKFFQYVTVWKKNSELLKQCTVWFFKLTFIQLTENSFGTCPKPDPISVQNFSND